MFYDPLRKASEETELNVKVQENKHSLNKVKYRQETPGLKKYSDEEIINIIKQYGAYFKLEKETIKIIDEKGLEGKYTTISFTIDKEKLLEALKYKGYLLIMTKDFSKTSEAELTDYRDKEVAENAFDDVKNLLDMKRLNIRSDEALQSKIFLVFLSLIFVSYIRNTLKENNLNFHKKLPYTKKRT